ncbi:COG3014 family protein [Cysteiniphilum litorale]|uniref:COG3014 family protein n=1 Tax=Cysteiniphilum litorale TaxID=2056700 RepID=UPI003F8858AD
MAKIIKNSGLSLFCVSTLMLSGCATFSASYPNKMKQVKADAASGNISQAQKAFIDEFGDKPTTDNLYLLEQARLAQLNGNVAESKKDYQAVIQTVATSKMAAKVQVSKMLENMGAVLTNDRELPFSTPDYAMTFLYPYQALNYLSENDLSGALVAIRQLSNAQYWTYQQKLMAGDLQSKYQKDTSKAGVDQNKLGLNKSTEINQMFSAVKDASNAYENGFGYYLASILYQAFDDNYNNAFISIKDAKRLLPDNPYVLRTYKEIERGFNGGNAYESGKGRLVVLYEQGFVTPREAFKLPLFLGKLGLQEVAVAYYPSKYTLLPAKDLYITQDKKIIDKGQTSLLVNTTQMAMKSLTEEYPAIITREVIRLVVKSLATYEASNQAGGWGLLAGSIYSFMTAQADERSWLLLPNNIQLFEQQYTPGKYTLDIALKETPIDIKSNKTTLLWIVNMGDFTKVYHFII